MYEVLKLYSLCSRQVLCVGGSPIVIYRGVCVEFA